MQNTKPHLTAKRALIVLLLLLQVGFANAGSWLFDFSNVAHQHCSTQEQSQLSSEQQELHHFCFTHSHCTHTVLVPSINLAIDFVNSLYLLSDNTLYLSIHSHAIYRPPTLAA